jgi:ABC-type transporter Mla MlaB component
MDIDLKIEKKGDQVIWVLSGELTIFSLSHRNLANQWIKLFPTQGSWQIEAEKLSTIDTGGLAFLIECLKHAKKNKVELRFSLPSSGVENLIQAQGVSALIESNV